MKNTWKKNRIEIYSCPNCSEGTINFAHLKNRIAEETAYSNEMRKYGGIPPFTEELCTAMAKCSKCGEPVSIIYSKITNEDPDPSDYQQLSPAEQEDYDVTYEIKSIYPSPHLINVPNACPASVKRELIKSFKLYWIDEAACVNKIRITLDLLMDELDVVKGKLHQRITSLKTIHPELSEILEAVKWMGNIGSHEIKVEYEDVMKAYELLEYSLEELYASRQNRVLKISRDINEKNRKKP